MKTEILMVMSDPSNDTSYIATYSADNGNEAHNLAFNGNLCDAIEAALNVWGLSENDVYIEASN